MKNYSVLVSIISGGLLFLQSCGSGSDNITTPQELVTDGEVLSLQIDSQTSNVSDGLFAYEDKNGSWLFNLNMSNNEIQLYNLDSGKMHKRIVFDLEGPNGVGFVQGFFVHSMDSIFLFGFPDGELHLSDTTAKVISKINYEPPAGHDFAFIHNAYFVSDPILLGDKLLVKTRPNMRASEATSAYLSDKKLTYSIDLNSNEVTLSKMGYPADYTLGGAKLLDFSMARAEDKLVYSFIADHNLYVSDLEGEVHSVVPAKSQYLEQTFQSFPDITDRTALQSYLFASDRYERVLYDKYRGVFYRFVFPKVAIENEEEINQLRRFPRKFSVMILDKELNILGEKLMPENTYYPGNSFVGEEGLYISINHPDNPKNREDLMSFEVFKLRELE
ncbi:DUF4221 domain-containing protein [Algoriphagus sp. AGSA1]|uniref:DUF4221 family protein n=1 Tax=Algoriphagus sp. AGSA1 TaxID=2907213 RepID=UPI001F28D3A7|nr:DUF4221 family protein [Algoriphagus sp. AGSA1]MCE7054895.1 DUF4221 domain-containing protein [Algoriphagus sp. AGSA1]